MLKTFGICIISVFASLPFCQNATAKQSGSEPFFLVTKHGQTVYNEDRQAVSNRILLYISVTSSDTLMNEVAIEMEAVAEDAKKEIADNIEKDVNLPELVYESVQNLSKKVFAMRSAKTQKEFNIAKKGYDKVFNESDELISLHGFRLVKHLYKFEG